MEYELPKKITLTPKEQELYEQLPASALKARDKQEWDPISLIMSELAESLIGRKAIPELRWKMFSDPEYSEPGAKPMKFSIETHGTRGDAILRSPWFLEYLRYFVNGPDLPSSIVEKLYQIICKDWGLREEGRKFIRVYARTLSLDEKNNASKEFFRLAFEFGLGRYEAELMRKDAKAK